MTVWILSKDDASTYENGRLLASFKEKGISARVVDASDFDVIIARDISENILYKGQPVALPKVLLVRYGAGISKFMLFLIRQFENAGVTVVNTADSIEIAKDKLETSQILSRHKIPIPKTMMVRFPVKIGRAHV